MAGKPEQPQTMGQPSDRNAEVKSSATMVTRVKRKEEVVRETCEAARKDSEMGPIGAPPTFEEWLHIAKAQMALRNKGPPAIEDNGTLFTQAYLRRGVPPIERDQRRHELLNEGDETSKMPAAPSTWAKRKHIGGREASCKTQ